MSVRSMAVCAALLLGLAGCSNWAVVDGKSAYEDPDGRYVVRFPSGWVRLKGPAETLWLTRDGIALEQIVIFRRDLEKAFPRRKKGVPPGVLPHELAELQLAEFKAESETLVNAQVLDIGPALVSGREGYRLHIAWTNDDGLPLARLVYGATDDKYYYMIGFEAPTLHYFDKHKPAFEAMMATLRLTAFAAPLSEAKVAAPRVE